MECLGPKCAALILDWLRTVSQQSSASDPTAPASPPLPSPFPDARQVAAGVAEDAEDAPASQAPSPAASPNNQGLLFDLGAYRDEAPWLGSDVELAGAWEHVEYAVYRRYHNQLTRADRARLENTIQNTLYKIERYLPRMAPGEKADMTATKLERLREEIRRHRDDANLARRQARVAEQKLAQLDRLTPEEFENFVAELFDALGYQVTITGGGGDQGVDIALERDGLRAIVQCKYQKKSLVGSPELQKFLGAVHRTHSHKGYFVTTSAFTLAAEKLIRDQPIELIDGPRLGELVREALGPAAKDVAEPDPWFI